MTYLAVKEEKCAGDDTDAYNHTLRLVYFYKNELPTVCEQCSIHVILVIFKKCEARLIGALSAQTAISYFLLAYLHEATNLKIAARALIVENYENIVNSRELESIAKHYPRAMLELFGHACQRE